MTARALAQTMADGRHEWRRATNTSQRLVAGLNLAGALARVLACLTWTDACKAIETAFVRRWLLGTTVLSASLWAVFPLLQHGSWPAHFYLVDLGEIFVMLAMPAFLLLSLARRRDSRVPRLGTVTIVIATVMVWLVVLVPLGLPARYAAFHGRLYAPVPWFSVLQWLLVTTALAWVAIGLTDRVIVHDRRPFLTVLSLLLPAFLIMLAARANADFQPLLAAWRVVPYAEFAAAATFGAATLWAGLAWESHSNLQGSGDGR